MGVPDGGGAGPFRPPPLPSLPSGPLSTLTSPWFLMSDVYSPAVVSSLLLFLFSPSSLWYILLFSFSCWCLICIHSFWSLFLSFSFLATIAHLSTVPLLKCVPALSDLRNAFPFLGQGTEVQSTQALQRSWLRLLPWVHLRSPGTASFLFFALAAIVQPQLRLSFLL